MRPDVKLGIVVSMVFVMVAGTYFLVQDSGDAPISVGSDPTSLIADADKTPPASAKPKPASTNKQGKRRAIPNNKKPATRTAARRAAPTGPNGAQKTQAAPKRDSRQEQLAAARRNGRAPSTNAQRRRGGNRLASQRKQARPKQPKPKQQLSLAATPAPGMDPSIERHRVQQGDTIASLAKQYYGSTQFAQFLISQNEQLADPSRPRLGEIVNIVPRTTDGKLPTTRPTPSAREYRIKSGDSFYRIARDELGNASRWNELYELNKKVVGNDPTKLKIGQVIRLPKK